MNQALSNKPISSLKSTSLKAERPLEMGEGKVTINGQESQFTYEMKGSKNGAKEVEVNQVSGATKLFAEIGTAISQLIRKPAFSAAAAVAIGSLAMTEKSDAALMIAGASDADHKALGVANSNDVLWVESDYQGTSFRFSAIRINDYYAITAGHAVYGNTVGIVTPNTLGTGTNYLNDLGITSSIAEVIVYPTYSGINADFSNPDIAILRFSSPISGTNPILGNSITVGQNLVSAGFGQPGFTGGSYFEDGAVRGWNAEVRSFNPQDVNSEYYRSTQFQDTSLVALNGRGSNGDSGSPVYDNNGFLVGMTVGGTPSTFSTSAIGSTVLLDLTNKDTLNWINANIPEPTTATLSGLAAIALLSIRRRTKD